MSQSDLARLIEVSPQSVQLWESEKTLPKRSRIELIADALEISSVDIEFGHFDTNTEAHTNQPIETELNDRELKMLLLFRELNSELQDHLILIAESRIKPNTEEDAQKDLHTVDNAYG